ncbi:MAG: OmpA family protein [Gammaproteobacteria bacterium]
MAIHRIEDGPDRVVDVLDEDVEVESVDSVMPHVSITQEYSPWWLTLWAIVLLLLGFLLGLLLFRGMSSTLPWLTSFTGSDSQLEVDLNLEPIIAPLRSDIGSLRDELGGLSDRTDALGNEVFAHSHNDSEGGDDIAAKLDEFAQWRVGVDEALATSAKEFPTITESVDDKVESGEGIEAQEQSLREVFVEELAEGFVTIERASDDSGLTLTLSAEVSFDRARSTIKARFDTMLERLAGVLETYPHTVVDVSGHTDNEGTIERNARLSIRRANAVGARLSEKGVGNERIRTEGYADTKPRASNDTEEGRELNRRVEIFISQSGK